MAPDESAPPDLGQLIEEYAELKAEWCRDWASFSRCFYSVSDPDKRFAEGVIEQDRLLRQMIEDAFKETANFNLVKQRLAGVVEFRELPKDYAASRETRESMLKRDESENPAEAPTVVFVSSLKAPGRRDFYLMQNTHRRGTLGIVSLAMASVIEGQADYQRLPYPEISRPYMMSIYERRIYAQPMFLTSDLVPDVVAIQGPQGSGSFAVFYGIMYDDLVGKWVLFAKSQFNGPFWVDDVNSVLHYEEFENARGHPTDEESDQGSWDFAEWLRSVRRRDECTRQEMTGQVRP